MEFVLRYLRKLKFLLFRRQFNRELEEEMIYHREQVQKDLQADIASSDAASKAAYRQFGNQTRLKEQCHEVVVFRFESVAQDARYAIRQLLATPSFSLVIVLTLALSIGANTAIFSVIQGVLLKSLPFLEPEHLVRIFLNSAEFPKFPLNPFDFRDVRDRNHSFESMAAFTRRDLQLSGVGETARLYGISVTAEYFHVLGLRPELGREFDRRAEIEGNGSQVILSDRLWRTRFAAAPDILGRKITLDSLPFTVVGVMPAGAEHPGNSYHSLPYGEAIDVWSPFTFGSDPSQRGSHYMDGIARLKNGVTLTQANAEMDALMAQLERERGGGDPWRVTLIPLYQEIVGADRRILLVLLGAVAMVLLIACANAANLLLAACLGSAAAPADSPAAHGKPSALLVGRSAGSRNGVRRRKGAGIATACGLSPGARYSGKSSSICIHLSGQYCHGNSVRSGPRVARIAHRPNAKPARKRTRCDGKWTPASLTQCAGHFRSEPGLYFADRRRTFVPQPDQLDPHGSRISAGARADCQPLPAPGKVQGRRRCCNFL
jgi:hypothetical protein